MPLVTREYFGEQALGTAFGAVFFISCIGMGLGSYGGGFLYDCARLYAWLFLASGAIGTMAVVMAAGAPAPAPARVAAARA